MSPGPKTTKSKKQAPDRLTLYTPSYPGGNWLAQDQRSETTKSPARLTLYIPDPKNDQVKNSSPHWAYPTHVPNRLTPYMPDPRKRPSPPTGLPYTYPRTQKRPSPNPSPRLPYPIHALGSKRPSPKTTPRTALPYAFQIQRNDDPVEVSSPRPAYPIHIPDPKNDQVRDRGPRSPYPTHAGPQRHRGLPSPSSPIRPRRGGVLTGKSRRRRAYPQQIVTTRLLYCLQDPFAHLSRLQRI